MLLNRAKWIGTEENTVDIHHFAILFLNQIRILFNIHQEKILNLEMFWVYQTIKVRKKLQEEVFM